MTKAELEDAVRRIADGGGLSAGAIADVLTTLASEYEAIADDEGEG